MPSRANLVKVVVGIAIIGVAYYVITRIALSVIVHF
jgi:hypothetical protein